jgi:hypothetical protein
MVTQETDPVPYQNIRTSLAMAVQPQLNRTVRTELIPLPVISTLLEQQMTIQENNIPTTTTTNTSSVTPTSTSSCLPDVPFDSYYAINRIANGPPPPLTNPSTASSKAKRSRTPKKDVDASDSIKPKPKIKKPAQPKPKLPKLPKAAKAKVPISK